MAFDHRHSRDSRLQGSPQYVPYTQGCTQKLSRIGEWTQVDFVGLLTAGCTRSMHNARQIYRYSGDMHTLFRDWNCAFCHNLDIFFPTLHNDLKHVITTLAQILIGKNALLTHPVVRLGLDNFITIIVLDTRLVDTFVKKKKKLFLIGMPWAQTNKHVHVSWWNVVSLYIIIDTYLKEIGTKKRRTFLKTNMVCGLYLGWWNHIFLYINLCFPKGGTEAH